MLEIRKSYKNLSKRYHPDKNPDVEAQLHFQKVKSAYDVRIMNLFQVSIVLFFVTYLILRYYWMRVCEILTIALELTISNLIQEKMKCNLWPILELNLCFGEL